jgi:predicted P-loop ATPase/GTPase
MRVRGLDEDDAITIAPAQIEVCSDEQWQRAIDLLAELLVPAFQRRTDDSKAA